MLVRGAKLLLVLAVLARLAAVSIALNPPAMLEATPPMPLISEAR